MDAKRTCNAEGCNENHRSRGMCSVHYNQWWRTTYPEKMKAAKQNHYKNNREEILKELHNDRLNNLEKYKAARKRTYANHKDKELATNKQWRKAHPRRVKELKTDWYKTPKGRKYLLKRRYRYLAKLQARTPPWVDMKAIREFYKNRPEGMVVDHIVPLNGENVSGLHVPWNLQYLTRASNNAKGNKFNVG